MPVSGFSPLCAARPVTRSSISPTPLRAVFSAPRGSAAGSSTRTASLSRASRSMSRREHSLPISSSDVHRQAISFRGWMPARASASTAAKARTRPPFISNVPGPQARPRATRKGIAARASWAAPETHQQVIAALVLVKDSYGGATLAPFDSDYAAELIHSMLVVGGRFGAHKSAKKAQHLGFMGAQVVNKFAREVFLRHRRNMLTSRTQGDKLLGENGANQSEKANRPTRNGWATKSKMVKGNSYSKKLARGERRPSPRARFLFRTNETASPAILTCPRRES